jgi:cysteine desulfurase
MERIYFDHAATSPMRPEVMEAMLDAMSQVYGNPSSIHSFGRAARKVLDDCRATAAKSIGASEQEIIFTSGGTESDNMAVIGGALSRKEKGSHIITTSIEHHAVLHSCAYLEKNGFEVTYLPVDQHGLISIDDFKKELREDTILVSIMYGNNEVGSIQPIEQIANLLKDHQALFHTDAVQVYGVLPLNVKELRVDFLSVSSHKINGPKGMGFLYLRKGTSLSPLFFGGEQERKRRAGTENVPAIVGFSRAIELAQSEINQRYQYYQSLKESLVNFLSQANISFNINGDVEQSLPHILNISLEGMNVESLLVNLDMAGIAVSSGSACTAGTVDPSHVLVAMFNDNSERLLNSIRISFGYQNTEEQVQRFVKELSKITQRVKYK